MNWDWVIYWLVVMAGAGQAVLCLASPAIPVVLGWREKLAVLPKLMRQLYWTYACYILGAHVCFAVLSLAAPGLLMERSLLAAGVSGFIALWWAVRLALHLASFDTAEVPEGGWYRAAEWGLGLLFVSLTAVYVLLFAFNLGGIS